MTDLQLNVNATLGDLPLHDLCVSYKTLGQTIADSFEQNPRLPGILIEDEAGQTSLISRRQFHERMSSPYGLEIFLRRPIAAFLEMSQRSQQPEILVLPNTEKIEVAVQLGLNRSPEAVYDPIVVVFEDRSLPVFQARFLVDFHTILLAQSQVLSAANQAIQQQQQQTQRYVFKLNQEQLKVKEYTKLLEEQQAVIRERNRVLESQQDELLQKSEEIAELNRRFMEIGKILSQEGKKAFQATFAGVNDICRNADQVLRVGEYLNAELSTIEGISTSIAKVSRQVHHLSVKASIVANRSQQGLSGFSTINEEISNLVGQTLDAGTDINQVAARFHDRIEEFTHAAQEGITVARSLISQTAQAQIALNELECLIHPYLTDLKLDETIDQESESSNHPNPFYQQNVRDEEAV
jgi:hypothetical protein